MNVYTLPDGSTVLPTDQFQIGDQKYPPGWIETAPAADIAAIGITVSVVADPVIPPQPIIIQALAFRQLFTMAERLAITTAGETTPQIREFMDDEAATPTVNLSDPEVTIGIAALVSAGLLTQDRANAVLAGTAPTT